MNQETLQRWFGFQHALDHPLTVIMTASVVVLLGIGGVMISVLGRWGRISPEDRLELGKRYRSWLAIVPLLLAPILLGAFWTILGVGLLSLLCYQDFARATGLFREKIVS